MEWPGMLSGLLIRSPHIDWILAGNKTWEIRGSSTVKRGRVALIVTAAHRIWKNPHSRSSSFRELRQLGRVLSKQVEANWSGTKASQHYRKLLIRWNQESSVRGSARVGKLRAMSSKSIR
jgi:hypothetical protein